MNHSHFIALAKQNFSKVWLMSSVATFLYSLLVSATQSFLIFTGPFAYGYADYIRQTVDYDNTDLNPLVSGFNRFVETMVAGLLYSLIIQVGLCLLIVPGIIAALGLSMTFYIMVEDPTISGLDALKKSWQMMKGYKSDYFLFCCRFIGWILICVLTFGLASFVVNPYFERAKWHYFRALACNINNATSIPQPPVFIEK